jgi:hypothetical protein
MEQEEQFASRKTSRSQVIFLIRDKNKNYIQGPRIDQDGNPSHGFPTALADYHCNTHSGLPQQLAMHVTSATRVLQLQPKYWSN